MVLLDYFHSNFLYVYTKTTLQMFHLCIYHELSSPQIASSHCILPSLHFKDDGECGGNFTTNNCIFNTLTHSTPFNSSFASIIFNKYASYSCLHLCSLFCTSFSFVTLYNFSIVLSTLMLLWTLEFQKCSQLLITNENNFRQFLCLFLSLSFSHVSFIF
jgi:hypothetical protein